MKYLKRFNESESKDYDFYMSIYDPLDKFVVGAYMIIEDSEKSITVLNLQEKEDTRSFFADGRVPYTFLPYKVILPKSQIEILGPVEGKEGFEFIKIPYWLYKKMSKELSIKRYTGKKRLSIARSQVYGDYLKLINDPNVEKYFRIIDTDESSLQRFKSYQRHYKP